MTGKPKKTKDIGARITELLQDKGLYEDTDQIPIEELVYQLQIITEAKKEIATNGILVNVRAAGTPLLQVNQAVGVCRDSVKSIVTLCTKLGLTPQERSKLKSIEKNSGFDLSKFLIE